MIKQGTLPQHVRDIWAKLEAEREALLQICTAIEDGDYKQVQVRHTDTGR
jgi:hypothetical protein